MNNEEKIALRTVISGCEVYAVKYSYRAFYDEESNKIMHYPDAIRIMKNYLKKDDKNEI